MQRLKKKKPELNRATEEKLIGAATEAFIKYGLEGARMQDIADEAGISKSMLHYYFSRKEQLFERIFRQAVVDIFSKLRQILDGEESVMAKINRLAKDYIDFLLEHPYLPLFVLHESHKDPTAFRNDFLPASDVVFSARFAQQIEKEVKEKKIRSVTPNLLLVQIMSMCVFPIVAQPVLQGILDTNETNYRKLLSQIQTDMPAFFKRQLTP